jgi:acyl carrier protein
MDVAQELRAIIGRKVKGELAPDVTLMSAGLDSLDIIELGFDIEDRFNIQLPRSGSELMSLTFGDLCWLVEQQLASKNHIVSPDEEAGLPLSHSR